MLFIVYLLCLFNVFFFTSFVCVFILLICVRWFVRFPRFIFQLVSGHGRGGAFDVVRSEPGGVEVIFVRVKI